MSDELPNPIQRMALKIAEIDQNVSAIYAKLVVMERMFLAAIPRSRIPRKLTDVKATPEMLLEQRVDEVVRIFEHNIRLPYFKRAKQNYPSYLLENSEDGPFGAMTESVLVNRLSLRKAFQMVAKYRETSAVDNAHTAIKEADRLGRLKLVRAKDANIPHGKGGGFVESETLVVMSHECWERLNNFDRFEEDIQKEEPVIIKKSAWDKFKPKESTNEQ